MKVKILNDGGFKGMGSAVGKVVHAIYSNNMEAFAITGRELMDNGAMEGGFGASTLYYFWIGEEAEIAEDECLDMANQFGL